MLIEDHSPHLGIFFVGSLILGELLELETSTSVDLNVLYKRCVSHTHGAELPFSYFLLALDWLFLLERIKVNGQGDIVRCF